MVLLVFVLGNCAAGNVWLTIQADGSGKMQFVKKEYKDHRKVNLAFLRGVRAEETELSVTSMDVRIANIHEMELQGADFFFFQKDTTGESLHCLLFTLNTDKSAEWFRYFGISMGSIKAFEKESRKRDDLARFNNLTDYVVWEINLPGKIVSVRDYEPLPPEWWFSNHQNRKAVLKIPVRDILNSRRPLSTYEVCSQVAN